ncbi:MAG TPA: zf-TFIIB domain-containing protein [Actinophytocola sp.]|uniref:TFIIB-type zinc ribbon-containing protein n=1 Tax=Actinophytocola sp. TaxID=1872138 RepID=UPI002DDCA3D9|nr:zf-TFIIB domain-containing protein [Actinophytocola sp.]HEV2781556.1 zf-TFIIB domain-containing protein [Actinophytocola sp.]
MICPKCQNVMKTVDRMGIHIDQCEGCRGIFLDRGELEQIVGAEQRYVAAAGPPPAYQPEPGYRGHRDSPAPYHGGHRDSPPGYGHGGYRDSPPGYGHGGHGHGRRKRRSFLEELFD